MIQIGEKPSPTFAQPLELMSDCHRRVEMFLRALILVSEQAQGGALNKMQRDEFETALRYFREAAPNHTADEEQSLFPRMRKLDTDEVKIALRKIEALEADHQVAKVAHEIVEKLGQRWLALNALTGQEVSELNTELKRLAAIYVDHIRIEDNEVFPLAHKVLSATELNEVGHEMARRRGQPFRAG
ncbi:MAG: hemerythrin domain-containing protein [Verrucomicrobia bacterium]|nr:hemerythrin domain-containing protein [Verrucomicrobiota bacterium]